MLSSIECGINLETWSDLELGQIVDVVIAKVNLSEKDDKSDKPKVRQATQEDWDRFSN